MYKNEYSGYGRRRYTRIPFRFPVRFVFCGDNKDDLKDEGIWQFTFCTDISMNGIQLKLKEKPKIYFAFS